MEQIPAVHVIIPVYKAEKYIVQTLDSVLAQPYPNIRIVCVDDGSPDDSISILRDYEKRYENVHVLRRENGGISRARNTGIEYVLEHCAESDFIAFLDADDLWVRDTLTKERMSALQGIDCVGFVSYACTNDASRCERMPVQKEMTVPGGQKNVWLHHNFHFGALLYSCRLFQRYHVRFVPGQPQSEDQLFRFSCLFLAEQIKLMNVPLYCYRYNPASVSHTREFGIEYLAPIIQGQFTTYAFLKPYANEKRGDPLFLKMLCGVYAVEMAAEHYQMLRSPKALRTYLSENPEVQKALDELTPQDLSEGHLKLYQMYIHSPTRFMLRQYGVGVVRKLYRLIGSIPPVAKAIEQRRYPLENHLV